MITGLPIDQVMADFHDRYQADYTNVTASRYLDSIGLPHTTCVSFDADGIFNDDVQQVYAIATINSLNVSKGLHATVLIKSCDALNNESWLSYDPQIGNAGQHYMITVCDEMVFTGSYSKPRDMPPLGHPAQDVVTPCVDLYVRGIDLIEWRRVQGIPVESNDEQECAELYDKAVAANTYSFDLAGLT